MTVLTVWFTSLHFLLNEIDILNVDVFNGMKNSKEKMTSRHGALHHLYIFGAEPFVCSCHYSITLMTSQGLAMLLIILLAVLGNLLVIVSVLRTKNLRRQKAYYFVVSLALAGGGAFIAICLLSR